MWLKSCSIFVCLLVLTCAQKTCDQVNTTCSCHMVSLGGLSTKLDLSCPSDRQDHALFTYLDQKVEVICKQTTFSEDGFKLVPIHPRPTLNFLPNLNETYLKSYKIRECPLTDDSFDTVWHPMGVDNLEALVIENTAFPKNKLEDYYFHAISNHLVNLSLLGVQLEEIDKEVFALMKNLETLDINQNRLTISEHQFSHLTNLLDLRLHNNLIEFIPSTAFKGLKKLVVLHLWSNLITSLNPDTFSDLISVNSLELSDNKLEYLPEDIFANMKLLRLLNLGRNDISKIPPRLFANNRFLEKVRIENMKGITSLPDGFFSNYTYLEEVKLMNCSLNNLSEDLFRNSHALRIIHLQYNEIDSLPTFIFEGLKNVVELKLNGNKIKELSGNLFKDLVNLEILNLGENRIKIVPANLLTGCKHLIELHLNNNDIDSLALNTLYGLDELTTINLSFNNIDFEDSRVSALNYAVHLEDLDLSNNRISYMHDDLRNKIYLKNLHLDNNRITYIDYGDLMGVSQDVNIFLQRNMITVINLTLAERLIKFEEQYENNKVTLYVDDNPLICDCKNYDLFRYFNLSIDPMVQIVIQIKASELVCSGPPNFVDIKACDVKPHMVTCNVEECPSPCDCAYQPYKSRYIIDCTSRNLSSVPELLAEKSTIYDYKSTAVYLQNNSLKEGPRKGLGYEGINVLNLANNNIRRLKWIPNNLDELNVEGNNISSLEPSILGKLNFTKAFLRNNPWSCECSAINFLHYLKDYVIPFKGDIRCAVDGKQMVTLKDKDICWWHEMMITLLIILAVIFITVPSIMMGIYYKYNQEIKVWLYAHNLCLWFVTDEDLDKDKKYDAFISYSHVDEAFVVEELVSKLEDGPNPYKLCIHVRDWIPGEIITTQVTQSVENSRRTIIVLSPNFLNSVWGKLEFRTAHTQAIQEGRTRVIIILLGDIDLNSNLDEELKAYLKTNTYIKWGDRWFWDKLRFALPHNPNKRSNRKFENISVKIDKMDLMRGSMLPNPGTTPPVDPLLSKLNPLQFKSADDAMVTPPAESGANHI